jgi:predicted nucleic acid-binding protein
MEVTSEGDRPLSGAVDDQPLGVGEKSAIQLALDVQADIVLLDDRLAREYAADLGLTVKGTLGVLVDAYRREHLSLEEVRLTIGTIIA